MVQAPFLILSFKIPPQNHFCFSVILHTVATAFICSFHKGLRQSFVSISFSSSNISFEKFLL